MLFLARWFGVTGSDAERNLAAEPALIEKITDKVLLMQSKVAAQQHRPLARGTHAKGTSARAQLEVFDVIAGPDPELADRLAKGIFSKPAVYPATVRFANANSKVNSDFKADVRALSFSVELTQDGITVLDANAGRQGRQDFSLQNTTTLPINDSPAFLAIYESAHGFQPSRRLVVSPVQGQVTSAENSCLGASAGTPENRAVSKIAVREQYAVSSWTDRYCEVFGNTVPGQSGASSAKE